MEFDKSLPQMKTFKTKHDIIINKGEIYKMPLEAYYEHGGLRRTSELIHRQIFVEYLSDSMESNRHRIIGNLIERFKPRELVSARVGFNSAIDDLKHRGFLEGVRGRAENEVLRINPTLLDQVAKFVKRKK